MDCIHCVELICLKGDEEKTERLKKRLDESIELLKRAENAVGEGYAGSDRWLEHHRSAVKRLTELCSIMNNPDVPVGSIIQLASPKSSTKRLNESIKVPNAHNSAVISKAVNDDIERKEN
jgi:hypothetical protein